MQLKYISATEGLLSILALERLHPCMPSLVSLENLRATEGLVTQVARKKAFHRCVFLYAFGDLRID